MKLLMRDEAKGREHTIFVTIFSALMVMLAIVVMLMASATAISGVTLQLDKNAVDILDKQVENRAGYIQDQLQQAQELTDLSTYINETAQQMLDDETLSLKTLDSSSSDSLPLLLAAAFVTACFGCVLIFRPSLQVQLMGRLLGVSLILDAILNTITMLTTVKIIRSQRSAEKEVPCV